MSFATILGVTYLPRMLTSDLRSGTAEIVPTPDSNKREEALTPPARPGAEHRTHGDVPLLDAALLPPPPTDRRFSRLVRRIDFPALEQHVGALDAELVRLHDPVVRRFQEFLDRLAGEACPLATDNHKLVSLVNKRVDGIGIQLMHAEEGGELVNARLRYTRNFRGLDTGKAVFATLFGRRLSETGRGAGTFTGHARIIGSRRFFLASPLTKDCLVSYHHSIR